MKLSLLEEITIVDVVKPKINEEITITSKNDESEIRSKILSQFTKKWSAEEAEKRVTLLEEVISSLWEHAKTNNQRVDIKVHPEHLDYYVSQLQPKVRAVIEHVGTKVIARICKSATHDERIAKVIKLINIMDHRANALKSGHAPTTDLMDI
jgi:hypothetical protein